MLQNEATAPSASSETGPDAKSAPPPLQKEPSPAEIAARRAAEVKRVRSYRLKQAGLYSQYDRRSSMIRQGVFYWNGKPRRNGMDPERIEIEDLQTQINGWNHAYYVWGVSQVEDAVYDTAMARLRQLETKRPDLVDSNSPTARIGSPEVSTFPKAAHSVPMLSLAKAHTSKEIAAFFRKGWHGLVEPKVDGVALTLKYRSGELAQAVTRGDGRIGDDVTLNARTIRNLPLVLGKPVTIEVRGEVYMRWSAFNALNQALEAEGAEPAANPRNAAAGALKLKDSREAAKRPMSFMAYDVVDGLKGCLTQEAVLEELEVLGFSTTSVLPPPLADSEHMTQFGVDLTSQEQIEDLINRLEPVRRVQDFPTDGLVFKPSLLEYRQAVGMGNTAPKWAIAYKYPAERGVTTLLGITVTVGKTGKLTPVASLAPVLISGSTVARASVCNQDELNRLGVNVGDEVLVEKASEIIPRLCGVHAKHTAGVFKLPENCPACGSVVLRPENLVDTFCFNVQCGGQTLARLIWATGKACLDMDGCGKALCADLVQQGVASLADLFSCKPRLKPAALKRFEAAREKAKRAHLWRKLHALCIEGWGTVVCQEVAARWTSLDQILDHMEDVSHVVGSAAFGSLLAWLTVHEQEVLRLDALGLFSEAAEQSERNAQIAGKVFVVTGQLMLPRNTVEDMIQKAGGLIRGSVSNKVNFLVVGEGGGVNKARDAVRHKTTCIDEDTFWGMMGFRPDALSEGAPDNSYEPA